MVLHFTIESIVEFFKLLNPHLHEKPVPSLKIPQEFQSTWYLSPHQHATELLIYTCIFVPAFVFAYSQAMKHPLWISLPSPRSHTSIDIILGMCAVFSFFTGFYYKITAPHSWRVPYMLQPCHVLTIFLGVCGLSSESKAMQVLFHIDTALSWSAVLAFLFPDLSDYESPIDMANYFVEHFLMLFIPFYFIYTRRYALIQSNTWMFLSYCVMCTYHVYILTFAGIISHVNIATLMSPPPPLSVFGKWYRPCQYFFVLILHFAYNHALCRLVPRGTWTWQKHEQKESTQGKKIK